MIAIIIARRHGSQPVLHHHHIHHLHPKSLRVQITTIISLHHIHTSRFSVPSFKFQAQAAVVPQGETPPIPRISKTFLHHHHIHHPITTIGHSLPSPHSHFQFQFQAQTRVAPQEDTPPISRISQKFLHHHRIHHPNSEILTQPTTKIGHSLHHIRTPVQWSNSKSKLQVLHQKSRLQFPRLANFSYTTITPITQPLQ